MNLIVAVDENWAIGNKEQLLVRIPNDHKMFQQETTGKVVILGRKTLETFPGKQPLKNRTNIILSRKENLQVKGATVVHSIEELLEECKKYPDEDIYVIGGESIYRQLLPYCDTAHVTKIDRSYEADAYCPNLDKDEAWEIAADSEEQVYFDLTYRFVKYVRKFIKLSVLILFCCFFLTGCAGINRDTKIVLTTGFTKDEVFRIESASCYKKEVMVYLTNLQSRYEEVYGPEIWQQERDGITLEESVKESVLAELAQIKTMNLMAEKYGISLSETEHDHVEEAAKAYYGSLTATEKRKMDVTLDTIRQLYSEYALADKVYAYIIQDVNPEISDDEARTVTLQQILIKTGKKDADGDYIPYGQDEKDYAYSKALEAKNAVEAGEDFEFVAGQYNEADQSTVYVHKGETDAVYEKEAFELGNGEVSDVFETEEGYYLLKCVSTLNREETDTNKEKIVEERRKETFSKEYDSFVQTLTRNMNEKVWQEISMLHNEEVTTQDFFDVYAEYCSVNE